MRMYCGQQEATCQPCTAPSVFSLSVCRQGCLSACLSVERYVAAATVGRRVRKAENGRQGSKSCVPYRGDGGHPYVARTCMATAATVGQPMRSPPSPPLPAPAWRNEWPADRGTPPFTPPPLPALCSLPRTLPLRHYHQSLPSLHLTPRPSSQDDNVQAGRQEEHHRTVYRTEGHARISPS